LGGGGKQPDCDNHTSDGPESAPGAAHLCVLARSRAEHATLTASLICLTKRALRSEEMAN
jgi:hypothetical protein